MSCTVVAPHACGRIGYRGRSATGLAVHRSHAPVSGCAAPALADIAAPNGRVARCDPTRPPYGPNPYRAWPNIDGSDSAPGSASRPSLIRLEVEPNFRVWHKYDHRIYRSIEVATPIRALQPRAPTPSIAGMWGWAKKAARTVGRAVKGAAKVVGHAIKGAFSAGVQWVKALWNRLAGIPEFLGTLFGIRWRKKVAVEVLILTKHGKPLASIADVQGALDLADEVFRQQMNVHIVNKQGGRPLILAGEVPARNLSVTCYPPKVLASDFSAVSDWFRDHQERKTSGTFFGYGQPITVFVVENVEGDNSGCCPGFLTDYAVIDPGALSGSEAKRLTLAHEVGHACGLFWHSGTGNLMKHDPSGRARHLSRLQKALFRSSGHVTYW